MYWVELGTCWIWELHSLIPLCLYHSHFQTKRPVTTTKALCRSGVTTRIHFFELTKHSHSYPDWRLAIRGCMHFDAKETLEGQIPNVQLP